MEPSLPTARGRGRQRRYTFGDVVILRVLEKLLAKGVSVKRLKESLISLRKFHPDISPDSLPASYLVTDGEEVFMLKTADTMETLDKSGQLAFAFILELEKVRDEVNLMIHELTATGGG